MSQEECKYWVVGHKFMNCKYCPEINQEYCKDNYGEGEEMKGTKICPRCGDVYLHHSLSRLDNKTKICGDCGNWEAMTDFRFLSELNSIEKINDKLNILGTLKSKHSQINLHEYSYFAKIENLLNAKLETLIKSN